MEVFSITHTSIIIGSAKPYGASGRAACIVAWICYRALLCCWPTRSTETEAVFSSVEYTAAEPRNAYKTQFFLSGGKGKMG